jgi:DHA1 family multidrug resistance protein-like MFS transporter
VTIPAAVAPLLREFPELDRRLWILAAARVIVTAGFAAVMPFLAMHLAVARHIPVLKIGLLWTAVGICSSVTQWFCGQVVDRIGRRRVMLAAMALRSANLAGLGYAIGTDASFEVIGLLCLFNGAMRAFYDPAASAVVASLAAPEERVAAFSLHRVGSSIGWAAGPLTAALASGFDYQVLFYVAAPVTLLAALAVATIPETRPEGPRPRLRLPSLASFAQDRTFVRFLAATFVFYLLQTQMYHIMAIYAAKHVGLDRGQVGTLFALNGVLVVLIQLPAVRYIRHLGTRGALLLGSLGYSAAYAACSIATSYPPLLACVALVTLSEIIAVPAQQATVTGMAPRDKVASYAGLFGFVQGAAQTAGPILGTCLIEFVSPSGAWLLLSALGLLAAVGYRARASIV